MEEFFWVENLVILMWTVTVSIVHVNYAYTIKKKIVRKKPCFIWAYKLTAVYSVDNNENYH
jgi:hypothetical protein